jgi:hypothetical protein
MHSDCGLHHAHQYASSDSVPCHVSHIGAHTIIGFDNVDQIATYGSAWNGKSVDFEIRYQRKRIPDAWPYGENMETVFVSKRLRLPGEIRR